jgi:hypothetical protein
MKKRNIAKTNYDRIIEKQPPKIMKMSKRMNVISIICVVSFIVLILLKFAKICEIPSLLFWSPLIIFGISFVFTIIGIMTTLLKDGIVTPTTIQQSLNEPQEKHNYHNHNHNHKRKKKRKHKKH